MPILSENPEFIQAEIKQLISNIIVHINTLPTNNYQTAHGGKAHRIILFAIDFIRKTVYHIQNLLSVSLPHQHLAGTVEMRVFLVRLSVG